MWIMAPLSITIMLRADVVLEIGPAADEHEAVRGDPARVLWCKLPSANTLGMPNLLGEGVRPTIKDTTR